jgi:UDP-N-acetylglucosamine:LPS N-acetylglucosamine transferase
LRYFVIRGVFDQNQLSPVEGEASFLNSNALQDVIGQSACVIARSGYSTIMDLLVLGKRAILVPTPGQTEQEYLADRWRNRGVLYAVAQADFNLNRALLESKSYPGFKVSLGKESRELKNAIDLILKPAR